MGAKSSRAVRDIIGSSSDEMECSFEVSSTTIDKNDKRSRKRLASTSSDENQGRKSRRLSARCPGFRGKFSMTRGKISNGLSRKSQTFARGRSPVLGLLQRRMDSSITNDEPAANSVIKPKLNKKNRLSFSDMTFVVFNDDESFNHDEPSSSTDAAKERSVIDNENEEEPTADRPVKNGINPEKSSQPVNEPRESTKKDHPIKNSQKPKAKKSSRDQIESTARRNLRKPLTKSDQSGEKTPKNKRPSKRPFPKEVSKRFESDSKKTKEEREEKTVSVIAKVKSTNSGRQLRKRKLESDTESQNRNSPLAKNGQKKRKRIGMKSVKKNVKSKLSHRDEDQKGPSSKTQGTGGPQNEKRRNPKKCHSDKTSGIQHDESVPDTSDVGCFKWFRNGSTSKSPSMKKKTVHITVPRPATKVKNPEQGKSPRSSPLLLRKSSRKIRPTKRFEKSFEMSTNVN